MTTVEARLEALTQDALAQPPSLLPAALAASAIAEAAANFAQARERVAKVREALARAEMDSRFSVAVAASQAYLSGATNAEVSETTHATQRKGALAVAALPGLKEELALAQKFADGARSKLRVAIQQHVRDQHQHALKDYREAAISLRESYRRLLAIDAAALRVVAIRDSCFVGFPENGVQVLVPSGAAAGESVAGRGGSSYYIAGPEPLRPSVERECAQALAEAQALAGGPANWPF